MKKAGAGEKKVPGAGQKRTGSATLVSCLLSHVSYLLSHISCLSHTSCLTSPVSCLLSHVSCLSSPVSRLMNPVSRLLSHLACITFSVFSPVSRLLSHISCLLSTVSRLLSEFSCLTSPVSGAQLCLIVCRVAAKIFVFVFSRTYQFHKIFLQFRETRNRNLSENFANTKHEIILIVILMIFVKWKKCALKFIVKIYWKEATFSWKLKLKSTYCEYFSTEQYCIYCSIFIMTLLKPSPVLKNQFSLTPHLSPLYPWPLIPYFSYLVAYISFLLPNPSFLILYPTSLIPHHFPYP